MPENRGTWTMCSKDVCVHKSSSGHASLLQPRWHAKHVLGQADSAAYSHSHCEAQPAAWIMCYRLGLTAPKCLFKNVAAL